MKKVNFFVVFIVMLVLFNGNLVPVKAEGSAIWTYNNPSIAIYEGNLIDGFYSVEYLENDESSVDLVNEYNRIYLLMINGSFVPNTELFIENNRAYIPIEIILEYFDVDIVWDNQKNLIISKNNKVIKINIDNLIVELNGQSCMDNISLKIINSIVYLPVRFIAESLGFEVDYISELSDLANISSIVIESSNNTTSYFTVDEGLVLVKRNSIETYERLVEFFKETDRVFDLNYKDYDPQDIFYTGENIGRYYVYRLKDDLGLSRSYRILFNKYTGEIYSEKAGLPIYLVEKGFINISWIYQ